ncbi:MAG: NADH:flavin oxidoreductase/NADH oxidase, partial [Deltaproteobacteria bacterium]|nr:NADH:flavin oxidoreductase/NADH oxidase [Deltaproteobacteria bacterium]
MSTPLLFTPFQLRSVTFRNRIGVSPMCQYSSEDGFPNDWHLVHLGARAIGGAALVMVEASAVSAIGRISPSDAGIWKDEHIAAWQKVTSFLTAHGAVPGVQLAHAGWKASTPAPWAGEGTVAAADGGWEPIGVGSKSFSDSYPTPREATENDIEQVCRQFKAAAHRAIAAGFRVVEVHAAHGYLLNSFLSPVSNKRTDAYGGSFENRTRLLFRVVSDVRHAVGDEVPLFVRLSTTDWVEGGWTLEDSINLSSRLRDAGVDLIDCSSGGISPKAKIAVGPGYQTEFAAAIRRDSKIPTAAVGMITDPIQAETIVRTGQADLVLLAR